MISKDIKNFLKVNHSKTVSPKEIEVKVKFLVVKLVLVLIKSGMTATDVKTYGSSKLGSGAKGWQKAAFEGV